MHPVVYICCSGRASGLINRSGATDFRGMISGAPAEPNIGASSTDNKSGFQTAYNQKEIIRAPLLYIAGCYMAKIVAASLASHRCARQVMLAALE